MGLSRILKKVNKASQAIRSIKGIQSKWNSIGYDTVINSAELQSDHARASSVLQKMNSNSSARRTSSGTLAAQYKAAQTPEGDTQELMYPIHDKLENYIVFAVRSRQDRAESQGASGKNLFFEGSTEIRLYVPDEINSVATVDYETTEVGSFWRGVHGDEDGSIGWMGAAKGMVSGFVEMGQKALNAATGNHRNLLQGRAVNPMQEQMLKGVSFRPWSFNYIFYPKSADEAKQVNKIIYTFRTAMLPDTYASWGAGEENFAENYFNFPNIFDVDWEGPIRDKVDRFLPMVCTQCNINHTGGLKFSTHKDGQPIKTTMQLGFLELKILTQESYQEISPLGDKSITSGKSFANRVEGDDG